MQQFLRTSSARRPRRAAFTLIEILVVIAIIALLAALLFPVFARARENARAKACLSNMQQLGLGFQQYINDYGQRYPGAGVYSKFGGHAPWLPGNGHWVAGLTAAPIADITTQKPIVDASSSTGYRTADIKDGALFPYVKSEAVYVCPSNSDGEKKELSYTMNCAISEMHTVRITQPTEIVVLVDEDKANDGYFFAVDDAAAGSTLGPGGPPTNSTDALTQVHNGGGNLLFADGHAKFYPSSVFLIDGSPAGKANKWRDSGVPRFHDPTFGPWGSVKFVRDSDGNPTTTDACNATKRTP